ncbi:sensor histidine kinase [Algoriphagus marinus]|uniref:sensor histidine kinase n=1 Tax=Algoriphagus marinus TaxID=1925762 RepID=UPI00094B9404|nr:PAS domain S-box protein [Algoriphagus marinus]
MELSTRSQKIDSLCTLIFENSGEAILVTDSNGKIVQANPSCLSLFEYTLDEIVGQEVEKLIPTELDQIHKAHRKNFINSPENRKMHSGLSLTGIKKSEEKLCLEIGLSYVKSENEFFIICFISNVSNREKWLSKIRYQQKLLKTYLSVTHSIFLILGSDERIIMLNKVGSTILGVSEKEAIGKNWFDQFLPVDEKNSIRDFFKKMINGEVEDTNTHENHIINSEGEKRLIEWNNTVIRYKNGVIEAILSNGVDITEKRILEDAKKEALIIGQEMERRRLAQELHDGLGQAISAIGLNMNALEPEIENFNLRFKTIYADIKARLDTAYEEIKAISKNLTPKILEDFGLEKALEYLGETIDQSTNVELHLSLHGDLKNLESKISLTIYRIVQELISNALRHAHPKNINIYVTRGKDNILLIVEDDGKGFDPKKPTTGLGISNLKSRIELFKGKLNIDSTAKGGTSISINIPL